jgi:hypothetical protein
MLRSFSSRAWLSMPPEPSWIGAGTGPRRRGTPPVVHVMLWAISSAATTTRQSSCTAAVDTTASTMSCSTPNAPSDTRRPHQGCRAGALPAALPAAAAPSPAAAAAAAAMPAAISSFRRDTRNHPLPPVWGGVGLEAGWVYVRVITRSNTS